jgi:hypothetical protein
VGVLLLDQSSDPDGRVHVRFQKADEPEVVLLGELKLLSLHLGEQGRAERI